VVEGLPRGISERRLRRLAWWLDDAFPIPGTDRRVGFDALIGLVPGVGDTIGALLSMIIIVAAARRGASAWTVTRMLGNVAIETVVGSVPIFGDVFDAVFKANQRNLALIGDTLTHAAPGRDSRQVLRLAMALVVVTVVVLAAATIGLAVALFRLVQ